MAGGTWESQNKVRPGVYIRFESTGGMKLNVGDRGTVAICEPLSWGPVAMVMEIEAGADATPYTGYGGTHPKSRFLNEIFKGTNRTPAPKKVLLYRPTAAGSAEAALTAGNLTATARYPGVRGNDIRIAVSAAADDADRFTVATIVDGVVVDEQAGAQVSDLAANDWVAFSGTGALTAAAAAPLTGGSDGAVQAAAYAAFLTCIEPYPFDILLYDGGDATVQQAMAAFVKRIANEAGQYAQLVTAGLKNADTRYVINVESDVTLADGTELTPQQATWWVGGAQAGARYNDSLTYAQYPGAVATTPRTNSEYIAALEAGDLVFFAQDGRVRIEQDINTLVTYTPETGEAFHKNRVMRLCNTIANDVYKQFADGFIGVVNNNEAGRALFKGAVVGYLLTIQGNQGIRDFTAEDVEVLPGEAIDAIVVNIAVTPVDSVEKIYLTLQIN